MSGDNQQKPLTPEMWRERAKKISDRVGHSSGVSDLIHDEDYAQINRPDAKEPLSFLARANNHLVSFIAVVEEDEKTNVLKDLITTSERWFLTSLLDRIQNKIEQESEN